MVTLTMLLMAAGLTSAVAQTEAHHTTLHIRAHADAGVDEGLLRRAQEVAEGLLAGAGVATAWRICGTAESCQVLASPVPEVVVLLLSWDRQNGDCGLTALGTHVAEGTVRVSVPCVARVTSRLSRRLDARSHPMLAFARHDELVGAVVAHEIGHVLGLRHASTGLMRARLEADDILALRQGSLGFSRQESTRMRDAARSARAGFDSVSRARGDGGNGRQTEQGERRRGR